MPHLNEGVECRQCPGGAVTAAGVRVGRCRFNRPWAAHLGSPCVAHWAATSAAPQVRPEHLVPDPVGRHAAPQQRLPGRAA